MENGQKSSIFIKNLGKFNILKAIKNDRNYNPFKDLGRLNMFKHKNICFKKVLFDRLSSFTL